MPATADVQYLQPCLQLYVPGTGKSACFEAKLQVVNVRRVSGVYCVDWMDLTVFCFDASDYSNSTRGLGEIGNARTRWVY
jgi:hypothetical protein